MLSDYDRDLANPPEIRDTSKRNWNVQVTITFYLSREIYGTQDEAEAIARKDALSAAADASAFFDDCDIDVQSAEIEGGLGE